MQQKSGNIHSKTMTNSSLKLGCTLMILTLIVSAMAVLFVIHAETDDSSAEVIDSGDCGEHVWYQFYSFGTLFIEGSGDMYDYSGLVRAPWYEYRDDITKIVIGDDITYLGQWAFVNCKHVTDLSIPITVNSVSSDMYCAFAGCYNIERIDFTWGKDGVGYDYSAYPGYDSWYQNTPWYQSRGVLKDVLIADRVKTIGSDAFRELNITSLEIPESVVGLGCHCFYNCTKLTDLTIPISLNSYGNEKYPAFQGCMAVQNITFTRGNGVPFDYANFLGDEENVNLAPWNLNSNVLKNIVISDNVTSLGNCMFYHCSIKELTIPISAGEQHIYRHYFLSPYNDLEKVTITKGTGTCYDYSDLYAEYYLPWNKAPNLQTVTVAEGVTHIGDEMFCDCRATSVVLPNSLISLGKDTFGYAVMDYLTLPISLDAVGSDSSPAFYHTSGLKKITFTPGTGYGFGYAAYKGYDAWYQNTPWYQDRDTLYAIVFEDGIKGLGSDAFRELEILSLVIPDSVESVGCHTFYNCSQLMNLTIPITLDSVYSAKYPAFEGCNSIMRLQLTAGTDGVGVDYNDCAPIWCSSLHSICYIFIDSGISYIGTHTFDGYRFIGSDGELLQPTAANLSGQVFAGTDGVMDQNVRTSGSLASEVMSDSTTVSISAGRR